MTLKQARELAGLSQAELDRRAGLATGTIHELESGRTESPSWERVVRIVRALRRAGLKGIDGEQLFPVPDRKVVSES
jgi:transcriptional regulator with XRE-family HTH domain